MTTRTDTCEQPLVDPSAMLARAERRSVALCDLRVDPELTCRRQIAAGRVKLMTEALRTGSGLEPLVVVVIDDTITLVDGHHRYRALMHADAGRTDVLVLNNVTTLEEARWTAFWLHWRAALPLTRKERRNGFRAYVEAGHHLATRFGRLKTYRDIASELGLPKSTLWHWMREEFPAIAARMAKEANDETVEASMGTAKRRNLQAIRHHSSQLGLLARSGSDVAEEAREALVNTLRNLGESRSVEELLQPPSDGYDF